CSTELRGNVQDFPQEAADGGLFLLQERESDGDEDANAFHLPRRYLDPRWREHRRACCRRRGLRTCNRHVPRHLRTLARHTHHLAVRRQGDRGQPPSARGVESIKSTTFPEVKKAPTSLYLGSKSTHW